MESAGGLSLASLLGILFIALKLTGVVHWGWLWVLAPFWIPWAIVIVAFFVVLLFAGKKKKRLG